MSVWKKKNYRLKDYSSDREIINDVKVYRVSNLKKYEEKTRTSLFFQIPDKVRNNMRISDYNESDFKIIIVRKEKKTSKDRL